MQAATSTATHAALFEPRWPYDGEAIEFPTSTPPFLGAALSDEPFDAAKHLAYVPPATVYDYRFRPHRVGALAPDFCGLGMTEPFQLLSDEGVKVARRLVDQHKFDKRFKSDLPGRQPFRLRGLGCGSLGRVTPPVSRL